MGPKSPGSDINQRILHGICSLRRRRLTGIGIPIINLRRSDDRLRFIMGIPILIRHKFTQRMQKTLAKFPTNFGVGWPWSSTSNSTWKSQFIYVHLATKVTTTTSSTAGVAPAGAGVRGTRQFYMCVIASLGNNKKFHIFNMSLRYVKWGVTKVCVSICTYL